MKQDELSADYRNAVIIHCRTLTAGAAGADPATQQRAALALLTILDCDNSELSHFESGDRFKVTFHEGTAILKTEGAVILQVGDKPPVGVKVEQLGTAGAPVGNIARMGAEDQPDDDTRTGGELADEIDPNRTTADGFNAAAELDDDGDLSDPAAYEPEGGADAGK